MHPFYFTSPLYDDADTARVAAVRRAPNDHRDPFERDRARIIHSFSFRRLQSKTQIFSLSESAFLRTRLTHSLEVGNIGRAIAAVINREIWPSYPLGAIAPAHAALRGPVDTSLIEAACLAHDLGHPPFGHRGEEALNHCLWSRWPGHRNGFEGNGQTLRLLAHPDLEVHAEGQGLNLTRATLQAVLKYPAVFDEVVNADLFPAGEGCPPFKLWAPPKCLHNEERALLDWLLAPFSDGDRALLRTVEHRPGVHGRTRCKTLEAGIVELADDIAYGTHDVEDAFFARLIDPDTIIGYMHRDAFDQPQVRDEYAALIRTMGAVTGGRDGLHARKGAAARLIHTFIVAARLVEDSRFTHPRLRWQVGLPGDHRRALDALKQAVFDRVISGAPVQSVEYRGGIIIKGLFEAYESTPELLAGKTAHLWREAPGDLERLRVLTDFISGMTDDYAERAYTRLFHPGGGSALERL
jgi:dGTPase